MVEEKRWIDITELSKKFNDLVLDYNFPDEPTPSDFMNLQALLVIGLTTTTPPVRTQNWRLFVCDDYSGPTTDYLMKEKCIQFRNDLPDKHKLSHVVTGFICSTPNEFGYKLVWCQYKTSDAFGQIARVITDQATCKLLKLWFQVRNKTNDHFLQTASGDFAISIHRIFERGIKIILGKDCRCTIRDYRIMACTRASEVLSTREFAEFNRLMLHSNEVGVEYYVKKSADLSGVEAFNLNLAVVANNDNELISNCIGKLQKWLRGDFDDSNSSSDSDDDSDGVLTLRQKIELFNKFIDNPTVVTNPIPAPVVKRTPRGVTLPKPVDIPSTPVVPLIAKKSPKASKSPMAKYLVNGRFKCPHCPYEAMRGNRLTEHIKNQH